METISLLLLFQIIIILCFAIISFSAIACLIKSGLAFVFEILSLQNNLIRSTYDPKAMIYTVKGNDDNREAFDHLGNVEYVDVGGKKFVPNCNFNITARIGFNFVFLYEDDLSIMPTKIIFLKQAPDTKISFAELIEFVENNQDTNDINDVAPLNTMLFLALYGYMSHFSISVFKNAIIGYIKHNIYFIIRINSPLKNLSEDENVNMSYPFMAKLVGTKVFVKDKNKVYIIKLRRKDLNIKSFLFLNIQKNNEVAEKIYGNIIKNKLSVGLPKVSTNCLNKWKNMVYSQRIIGFRCKSRWIMFIKKITI
ncbi:hypothetical protein THOM_0473 [Trachipleistophora hominis]|uniref:Uncharacterized protein n=1 Tax=Trachipleistophora hominis TaxID=72359 RepID=L7JYZ1_TRAHO|nr:hypothetical protein THOM_0473 [Trachipleistophora hominis]